jgi:anti-sigma-K factor RskA
MNLRKEHSRIPDLKLERFLLGELDPEEADRIQNELNSDETLQRRVEELRRSNQELLERYPAPWMASEIRRKLETPTPLSQRATKRAARLSFWPIPALSMAAAVVAIMLLSPPWEWRSGTGEQPVPIVSTRIKGLDPQILLFRKTETGSERLENGAKTREHDLVLIRYEAAGRAFGVIFSIDGRGAVTRHFPLEGSEAVQLEQDGAVSLDFSYELDDAPRWERFFFVTSDSTFDLDIVFGAAQDLVSGRQGARKDSLQLPTPLHQTIFTLEKETSHE